MGESIGRIPDIVDNPHVHDLPNRTGEAMLTKMDQMIDIFKDLTAKLDLDAGVTGTDYKALLTDALKKLDLIL